MDRSENEMQVITVCCKTAEFVFPLGEDDDAWYCLDGRESRNGSETLKLNADRDVYAVYTDKNGTEHYGTVGDEDNKLLADNEGVCAGDRYIFYENPKAKDFYI